MKEGRSRPRVLIALSFGMLIGVVGHAATTTNDPWTIDFRYAPPWWQTSICLPDDWQKTLVGKEGSLLYDYPGQLRRASAQGSRSGCRAKPNG